MPQRRLIRTQLNILLLAVSAPLAALLGYTIYEDLEHDQAQAGEAVGVLAQSLADDMAALAAQARAVADSLASLGAGHLLDPVRCADALQETLRREPRVDAVVVAGEDGRRICQQSVAGALRGAGRQPGRAWPAQDIHEVSGLAATNGSEGLRRAAQRRLLDAEGRAAGSVSVLLDIGRHAPAIDFSRYAPGTSVEIREGGGEVLVRLPGPAMPAGQGPDAVGALVRDDRTSGVAVGADGVERLYALAPVRGTDWRAVAGMPTEVILAPTRALAIRNSVIAAVIIGGVGVIAWIIAGRISRPIRRMAVAAQTVAGGDLHARVEVSGPVEIAEVAERFNAMVTARLEAEGRLREAHGRLSTLSRRLLGVQEAERRRIARELHDEIGQALTAVSLRLQAQRAGAAGALAAGLDACIDIVDGTLAQVRRLSLDLRPPQLDDLGLVSALRWQADRQAQAAGIAVHLAVNGLDQEPAAAAATACFRVAQEAVTNVVRHANARHVWIELRAEAARLHLVVRDDGRGFDVAARRREALHGGSVGLLSMEERTALAGGEFAISSGPGQGTEVRVVLPLDAEERE